jgi:hypothetical protein
VPEDKDFKRLVRSRMAETGEPYTKARAELRPDDSSVTPDDSGSTPGPVTAVYRRAVNDPDFAAQLATDPEGTGRQMGLSGSDLAELVGSQRFAATERERGQRTVQIATDIAGHDRGQPWPFTSLSATELADRASLAELSTMQLQSSRAMGIDHRAPSFPDVVDWATALRDEIRRRLDSSDVVDTALADALIRAINLIQVARRLAPEHRQASGTGDGDFVPPARDTP